MAAQIERGLLREDVHFRGEVAHVESVHDKGNVGWVFVGVRIRVAFGYCLLYLDVQVLDKASTI